MSEPAYLRRIRQSTHIVCFVGFHEFEQLFTLGVVQLDEQVVIQFHFFEDLRGTLVVRCERIYLVSAATPAERPQNISSCSSANFAIIISWIASAKVGETGVLMVRHEHDLLPAVPHRWRSTASSQSTMRVSERRRRVLEEELTRKRTARSRPDRRCGCCNGDVLNDGVAAAVEQAHTAVKSSWRESLKCVVQKRRRLTRPVKRTKKRETR